MISLFVLYPLFNFCIHMDLRIQKIQVEHQDENWEKEEAFGLIQSSPFNLSHKSLCQRCDALSTCKVSKDFLIFWCLSNK